MKKLFCILAATALLSLGATAQTSGHFGVRVGGEIACPGDISQDGVGVDAFSVGGGIEFGVVYTAPISAGFYIEPGLKLYYNQYSFNKDVIDADASIRKFGMRIPVQAGYRFGLTDEIGCMSSPAPNSKSVFRPKNIRAATLKAFMAKTAA